MIWRAVLIFALCFAAVYFMLNLLSRRKTAARGQLRISRSDAKRIKQSEHYNNRVRAPLKEQHSGHHVHAVFVGAASQVGPIELFVTWTDFVPALIPLFVDYIVLMHVDRQVGAVNLVGFLTPRQIHKVLGDGLKTVNETHQLVKIDRPDDERQRELIALSVANPLPKALQPLQKVPPRLNEKKTDLEQPD